VQFDDLARNRQAQPQAVLLAFLGAEERVKDLVDQAGLDPRPLSCTLMNAWPCSPLEAGSAGR
jgi:hypothetical protein